MEDISTEEKIITVLKEKFADDIVLVESPYAFPTVTVKPGSVLSIIRYLYDQERYQYLTTLCGIHYPDLKSIAVMYQLHNLFENKRIRFKTYLSEEAPSIGTLTTIFPAANWMERETYDFYGVNFEGHPNLKRILNVEDMTIFPLRKEYPLEDQTREDKNNTFFGR